jgi:hypothetical protein
MATNAIERAQELMAMKRKDLPLLAFEYSQHLCRELGMCMDVMFTAFAAYAQCKEGFPCSDEAYYASPSAQNWFRERGYDSLKPFVSDLERLKAENEELRSLLAKAVNVVRKTETISFRDFAWELEIDVERLNLLIKT